MQFLDVFRTATNSMCRRSTARHLRRAPQDSNGFHSGGGDKFFCHALRSLCSRGFLCLAWLDTWKAEDAMMLGPESCELLTLGLLGLIRLIPVHWVARKLLQAKGRRRWSDRLTVKQCRSSMQSGTTRRQSSKDIRRHTCLLPTKVTKIKNVMCSGSWVPSCFVDKVQQRRCNDGLPGWSNTDTRTERILQKFIADGEWVKSAVNKD